MIDPREAVTIARQLRHEPTARAEVWASPDTLVVGFEDGRDDYSVVLVAVDARTGAARTIGAGEFTALGGLQPVYQSPL